MPESRSGRLIAVEGVDGSGKSTVAAAIAAALSGLGEPSVAVRPLAAGREGLSRVQWASRFAGTATAGVAAGLDMPALYLTYAFVGAVAEEVVPALAAGTTVVCDRYRWSHQANQAVFGIDLTPVEEVLAALPEPDVVVHLRCDSDVALARVTARGGPGGVFDDEVSITRAVAEFDRCLSTVDHLVVDASLPPGEVLAAALKGLGVPDGPPS
jgi:dTMP kinase